jgi:general stress protein CsbA
MKNDPELKRLIDTWKEDDMLATQQLFRPGLLSWRNRAQSIAALVTLVLFIATVGATWIKAWLRGNWQLAVLAVVMTAGLVVFANIVATIRRRSAQTVELLAGSPEDVLQGRRQHLVTLICGATQARYLLFELAVFPLAIGMTVFQNLSVAFTAPLCIGFAAVLLFRTFVLLPRHRAELARLDAMLEELKGG